VFVTDVVAAMLAAMRVQLVRETPVVTA
jgi:hypothetical protein